MLAIVMTFISMVQQVTAHSWIEMVQRISSNGTLVGQGYPRNFVKRVAGRNIDSQAMYAPVLHGTVLDPKLPICKPVKQSTENSQEFPPLEAPASSWVALLYQDNGHVTFPFNQAGKPPGGGHVYVYGTPKSQPTDSFEPIWDPETHTFGPPKNSSSGMKLLAVRNYDDGICHQAADSAVSHEREAKYPTNPADPLQGANVWCQTDLQLPEGISDTYTLYWIWNWRTEPHRDCGMPDGKDEIYTSCIDIKIVDAKDAKGSSENETPHVDPKSVQFWETVVRPDQLTITGLTAAPSPPTTPSMNGMLPATVSCAAAPPPASPPSTPTPSPAGSPSSGAFISTNATPSPATPTPGMYSSYVGAPTETIHGFSAVESTVKSVALPNNMFPVATPTKSANNVGSIVSATSFGLREGVAASGAAPTKMTTLARKARL
ncbi:hypothetical protein AAP_01641 [Ascosphaera apis ARSEF 7405]|uniref:DUF7492 domain-containing protein n=1 Tax=Ascosphaera apis ARSEF 7405 TaxID=392613 RepID=A0A162ILG0_9EURO|nr:hypothetical protein AAP_01641 [Ascosphaera apis ARSEF 7405]